MGAWRRHGLDVDLASLTYPGETDMCPRSSGPRLAAVERDVVGLFSAVGLAGRWRGDDSDAGNSPRYVTATRV